MTIILCLVEAKVSKERSIDEDVGTVITLWNNSSPLSNHTEKVDRKGTGDRNFFKNAEVLWQWKNWGHMISGIAVAV